MQKGASVRIAKMADWVDKGTTPGKVFDKFQLKTMQKAILNCLLVSDVIANLPTGFGKSLLFQYPASLQKINSTCVILIVPLKALLWDSIRQARQLNIVAQQIDSNIIKQYYQNDVLPQLLLATPQKIFAMNSTLQFLESLETANKIRLLVVDQCHCISQWGHDFRPAYLQLSKLRQNLINVRILALSATITPESREDLVTRMHMGACHYFMASYHRPNLRYSIKRSINKQKASQQITDFLQSKNLRGSPGIIYCQTIADAESLYKQLNPTINAGLFHSKLSEKLRKQNYDKFMEQKVKLMISTICFGMGINKKNIRYVIHLGISKSPQNYYQESGRAGRDGLPAQCMIVSYPTQMNSLSFLIGKGQSTTKQKKCQFIKLNQINQYSVQQTQCRRQNLFKKLGQNFNKQLCAQMCDICANDNQVCIINKLNCLQDIKAIIQQLQIHKKYFTKKQLIYYLKGKSVKSNKRDLQLGESIKGKFEQYSQYVIEKIVQQMINRNLLTRDVRTVKSMYMIEYYKVCIKLVSNKLKQFIVTYKQQKKQGNTKNKKQTKKTSSFSNYLQKKNIVQPIKKQQKYIDVELIQEAQILKQGANKYQDFLHELFKQQDSQQILQINNQNRKSQIQKQCQEEQIIQISQDVINQQQQPVVIQQQNKISIQTQQKQQRQIQQLLQKYYSKKKEKQQLKRRSLVKKGKIDFI